MKTIQLMLYKEMIAIRSEIYRFRGVSSFWVLNPVLKQPPDLKRENYEYFIKHLREANENLSPTPPQELAVF
jgi:hypothetical protein